MHFQAATVVMVREGTQWQTTVDFGFMVTSLNCVCCGGPSDKDKVDV